MHLNDPEELDLSKTGANLCPERASGISQLKHEILLQEFTAIYHTWQACGLNKA